ncbi:MAG: hypothetical protein KJ578_15705 [Bacteroidetes bacterium]|nr:hypothetical protein [Bacteroidota bacterium]
MSASEIEVLKGHCEERLAEDKRLAETEELQKRMYANTYYWSNSGQ